MNRLIMVCVLALFATSALADERRFAVPLDDSPSLGQAGAPVTIVEFLDFQ